MTIWRRALVATDRSSGGLLRACRTCLRAGSPSRRRGDHSRPSPPAGTSEDPSQPNNRPNLSYEVDPGAVVEDVVTLYNYSNVPLNFRLYVMDAFNDDTGAFSLLAGDEDPVDVGTWVSLAASMVTIPAQSQATVPITVKVPADAAPGDHVGGLLASSEAVGTGDDGNTVTIDRRTGTRVYVRVAGLVEQDLAIDRGPHRLHARAQPAQWFGHGALRHHEPRQRPAGRPPPCDHLGTPRPRSAAGPGARPRGADPARASRSSRPSRASQPRPWRSRTFVWKSSTVAGQEGDLPAVTRRGTALAVPITLILLSVVAWLALRARRGMLRHRQTGRPPEAQPT